MALIRRAQQVTRLVKNAGRMREIVAAMTRFGFGTLVDRLGLRPFRSESYENDPRATQPLPVRIRLLFEQLGPTFIKVGQILGGRPDLVPPDFVREFEKLQDQVPPVPFNALRPVIEAELGKPLSELFASFDPEPLATASIAQVHVARTLDGTEVVVKVLKPDVDKLLTQDLDILDTLALLIERYVAEMRSFRPRQLVAEFRRALLAETNFNMEAHNITRYRANFVGNDFLVIPKVYPELSSNHVLTLERLKGIKLGDYAAVRAAGIDTREILRRGMDCFFQSMLVDGFFHGDPHGGNILVLEGPRLGLLDFGQVGRLSPKAKDGLVNMFVATLAQDYDQLVLEYMDMSQSSGASRGSATVTAIQKEVADVFAPYHGLPLKDIPMGRLLMEASGMAFRHKIAVPRDMVLVFKAVMTLEGIGRALDPEFDLVSAASKYTRLILKERYAPKKVAKELLFIGRDWMRLAEKTPRQLTEILRQVENGELNLHLQVAGLDQHARAQLMGLSRIAISVLACGLLIAAVLSFRTDANLPFWLQITLAVSAASASFFAFWRSFK